MAITITKIGITALSATTNTPTSEPIMPNWAMWTLIGFACALVVGLILLAFLTKKGKEHTLYYFYSFDKEMSTDTVRAGTDLTSYFAKKAFRVKNSNGTFSPLAVEGIYTDHHYTQKLNNLRMPDENYVVFLRFVAADPSATNTKKK